MKLKPIFAQLLIIVCLQSMTVHAQSCEEIYSTAKTDIFDNENYKDAIKLLEQCLDKSPLNDTAWALKGYAHQLIQEFQDAYDCYTTSIEINHRPFQAYYLRGILLSRAMDFDAAFADMTNALYAAENDEQKWRAYNSYAVICTDTRDFETAYKYYKKALELDSSGIIIRINLGAVCFDVGKPDEALYHLETAYEMDSTDIAVLVNIGFHLQELKRHEEAITWFDKALALDDQQPLGYSNRAFNLYKIGRLGDALTDINTSIKLYPTNSYAYCVRAKIYIAQGKTKKACADLKTAVDLKFPEMYGPEAEELQREHCR